MNTRFNIARFVISLLLTFSFLGITTSFALAVPPDHYDYTWSASYDVPDICAFPIHVDSTVDVHQDDFIDQSGAYTRSNYHAVEQDTFTANGKTLVGEPISYLIQTILDENGNLIHQYNEGVTEKVWLPDGSLFISAGRFDWMDHPGATFIIEPDKGHTGDIAAFCAALAP